MNRWKMNRIGFVNFWLYDEETFDFYDGKLMLRGQNGSGKSITTQSFIPFILDGDRTPSRLDPFGSSDRRMEYYFLGEEDRDESTGYLFLEFKKELTGEYRTIGIGQRAKRGKPMDFWGFIVLDGRRVGDDLWLYKETGSTKIPHSKREMKNILGEENVFTDSQSEYKKMVNQYIFGFRKAEHYEQFIKLLVKVRAPKLSKEFKPSRIYDILNESLQTLSDEDLRTMVDAMEKMDAIQESLELLKLAFSDVRVIRNEYTRYNQYLLAKKAQAYLSKKEDVEKNQKEYEAQQDRKLQISEELNSNEAELVILSENLRLAETEANSLFDTDLEEIDRKFRAARVEKEEVEKKATLLTKKIDEYRERIYKKEQELKKLKNTLEEQQAELLEKRGDLGEYQEILQWEEHEKVLDFLRMEKSPEKESISQSLFLYKKRIEECKKLILEYEELSKKYDEIAEELEKQQKIKLHKEKMLADSKDVVLECQDHWITKLFEDAKKAQCWKPQDSVLKQAENMVRAYQTIVDSGKIIEILRKDYEKQRESVLHEKTILIHNAQLCKEELEKAKQELAEIDRRKEIEPVRKEVCENSRKMLANKGIFAIPFYKAVEFAEGLKLSDCAKLEAQFEQMGLIDALVVAEKDLGFIHNACPDFIDTVIYASQQGTSSFKKLIPAPNLPEEIRKSVLKIISNIYEEPGKEFGIFLGKDGRFVQGMLVGRGEKAEAEFLGAYARERKRIQKIEELKNQIAQYEAEHSNLLRLIEKLEEHMQILSREYDSSYDFEELNRALEQEKNCQAELERSESDWQRCLKKEQECGTKKQMKYQQMLQECRMFPYERSKSGYTKALDALEEYEHVWQGCKETLLKLETIRSNLRIGQEYLEHDEQLLDDIFIDKRALGVKLRECDILIQQYEEYLNRPEIVQRARRLELLREEIKEIQQKQKELEERNIRLDQDLQHFLKDEPQKRECLQRLIAEETLLRKYFEEELSLKLILNREAKTLTECAKLAVGILRESDKNREYGDMLQSLVKVYQVHNGSLTTYGTSLEDCFDAVGELEGVGADFSPIRKRMRVVSSWNGKKVFLEEFYHILKTSIEETELLIQEEDRKLFEDILSQTISQQLTDRIAESRSWVKDMSNLMQNLDTSMGLSFSLEWKPRSADNDIELDTVELEKILLRDQELLTMEDIEKVAAHFRSKIRTEKVRLEEKDSFINYMELVRDALDYRKWFEFRMFYKRGDEAKKPLTNAAFNRFSGGEKAMAMYVPLFAAVNAQYKKAELEDHPRIIALDEAFAGVDDKNIRIMFDLVRKMDFDYIMNSQSLWGCYETVKGLGIAELHRPMNSKIVTIIRYRWNGHERILDEQ